MRHELPAVFVRVIDHGAALETHLRVHRAAQRNTGVSAISKIRQIPTRWPYSRHVQLGLSYTFARHDVGDDARAARIERFLGIFGVVPILEVGGVSSMAMRAPFGHFSGLRCGIGRNRIPSRIVYAEADLRPAGKVPIAEVCCCTRVQQGRSSWRLWTDRRIAYNKGTMRDMLSPRASFPVIDFAGVRERDPVAVGRAAAEIADACADAGFFYIEHHGVPEARDRRGRRGSACILRTPARAEARSGIGPSPRLRHDGRRAHGWGVAAGL